ncbi:MAG: PIN domain-containing protein, partial [Polynucleobacter sp.]|nr:PIN domain-containing protein [Polynucleobacter sp.]
LSLRKSRLPKNYCQGSGNIGGDCRKISSLTVSKRMKNASCFFDTNILLYLLSGDSDQAACVEGIVSKGGIISVQVLNEFASVASRKLGMTYAEIRDYLVTIRAVSDVRPLTVETHLLGLDIAERYGFS